MKLDVLVVGSNQGNSVSQAPVCPKSLCDASKRFWECYTVTPCAHDCTHSQNLLDASQSDFEHTGTWAALFPWIDHTTKTSNFISLAARNVMLNTWPNMLLVVCADENNYFRMQAPVDLRCESFYLGFRENRWKLDAQSPLWWKQPFLKKKCSRPKFRKEQ
jgi:hypothetical protein